MERTPYSLFFIISILSYVSYVEEYERGHTKEGPMLILFFILEKGRAPRFSPCVLCPSRGPIVILCKTKKADKIKKHMPALLMVPCLMVLLHLRKTTKANISNTQQHYTNKQEELPREGEDPFLPFLCSLCIAFVLSYVEE